MKGATLHQALNENEIKGNTIALTVLHITMMDEQLIDEVAQHGVIYNRQKYYLNAINGNPTGMNTKFETKDEAWQEIAMKLRSDVETCKKRWKYLRERYVSQRKQGDPPVYEHLSRPYLEKMKFLDQHIQPRKSYRNVPSFLTSPHSANSSSFTDYNMDSKSNSSIKNMGNFGNQHHYHQPHDPQHAMNALSSAAVAVSALENDNRVKIEADQAFRDFAAAVASQQLQHISQNASHMQHQAAAVAAAIADSPQSYPDQYRDASVNAMTSVPSSQNNGSVNGGIPSSSSSIKSPLSSPLNNSNHNVGSNAGHSSTTPLQVAAQSSSNIAQSNSSNNHMLVSHNFPDSQNDDLDSSGGNNYNMKKPRVQLDPNSMQTTEENNHTNHNNANNNFGEDSNDDSDDNTANLLQPQTVLSTNLENPFNNLAASTSTTALQRNNNYNHSQHNSQGGTASMFSSNADFLFQLYQQLPHQQQHHQQQQQQTNNNGQVNPQSNKFQVPPTPLQPQRCSEHLLGELVTTELLKMSKERRRSVQKRILEILFFDD